MVVAARR